MQRDAESGKALVYIYLYSIIKTKCQSTDVLLEIMSNSFEI